MKIKALSLWEPWATLMRLGAKTIETRSWPTSYRGPLLVCAAKRRSVEELFELFSWDAKRQPVSPFAVAFGLKDRPSPTLEDVLGQLHFGKAVAIVDLISCRRTERLRALALDSRELALGNFSAGRWGWETAHLRVIEPFPVRGHQGLFEVELPPGVAP